MKEAEDSPEAWVTNGTLPQQSNLEQRINISSFGLRMGLAGLGMRLPTSSVVVAWLQTNTSS